MRDATQATSSGKIVSKLLRIFGKNPFLPVYDFNTRVVGDIHCTKKNKVMTRMSKINQFSNL